jgi:hypothetical protein
MNWWCQSQFEAWAADGLNTTVKLALPLFLPQQAFGRYLLYTLSAGEAFHKYGISWQGVAVNIHVASTNSTADPTDSLKTWWIKKVE